MRDTPDNELFGIDRLIFDLEIDPTDAVLVMRGSSAVTLQEVMERLELLQIEREGEI